MTWSPQKSPTISSRASSINAHALARSTRPKDRIPRRNAGDHRARGVHAPSQPLCGAVQTAFRRAPRLGPHKRFKASVLEGIDLKRYINMKSLAVLLSIPCSATSLAAYAELSGSDTATADHRSIACSRAKNSASASMAMNRLQETAYAFNPADVPSNVKGCDCSEPSVTSPYWTCDAQWRLSAAPDAPLARLRGH